MHGLFQKSLDTCERVANIFLHPGANYTYMYNLHIPCVNQCMWTGLKSMGHIYYSAENYSTGPKFKLNLRILVKHLYTEFQFKMSICNGDNERKLNINRIFLSPRGITLPKIIWLDPNSNSTCVFSWQTYVPNFFWISPCMTEIMSGNWVRKDGMNERGNTICPSHFMVGHKNNLSIPLANIL